jgi:hypothetical protein
MPTAVPVTDPPNRSAERCDLEDEGPDGPQTARGAGVEHEERVCSHHGTVQHGSTRESGGRARLYSRESSHGSDRPARVNQGSDVQLQLQEVPCGCHYRDGVYRRSEADAVHVGIRIESE